MKIQSLSKERNVALDVLKLILSFMVVGIHTSFLSDKNALLGYACANGLFRIAVPIFFLINGFYFLPIIEKNSFSYWLKRVVLVYLFWTVVYMYFWFRPHSFFSAEAVKIFFFSIFIGHDHLWYMPALILAASMLFYLRKLKNAHLAMFILCAFLIGVVTQYMRNFYFSYPGSFVNYDYFHRNFIFFAFPFLAAGYLINKLQVHEKIQLRFIIMISTLGLLLLICESTWNYLQEITEGGFDNFIGTALAAPAIFITFLKVK
ncbi:acyltransferase family protein, partial [Desulfobulbus sp. F3]|nr:acyltransferase family protein [Desulfobulbus sp. F3]